MYWPRLFDEPVQLVQDRVRASGVLTAHGEQMGPDDDLNVVRFVSMVTYTVLADHPVVRGEVVQRRQSVVQ